MHGWKAACTCAPFRPQPKRFRHRWVRDPVSTEELLRNSRKTERALCASQMPPATIETVPPKLTDMKTWIDRTGHTKLRSYRGEDGNFWLEQNPAKRSPWATFAKKGHDVAWEFGADGGYTGRILIDGDIYTAAEATRKFLKS